MGCKMWWLTVFLMVPNQVQLAAAQAANGAGSSRSRPGDSAIIEINLTGTTSLHSCVFLCCLLFS